MMKIAHIVVVTPGRCGLYETTRELVAAERALGHDARMVDPQPTLLHPGSGYRDAPEDDRGAKIEAINDHSFAFGADVVVNHSGMDGPLDKVTAPVIYMSHGRPRSSFIGERRGDAPVYSYYHDKGRDKRFVAVATFWAEHRPYLEVMFPDTPVSVISTPVDLEAWTPDGPSGYGFHGKGGETNIVISDAWREDIDPFESINAFILFSREWPNAKLHLYGLPEERRGIDALLSIMQKEGTLGETQGWTKGLDNVYRSADVVVTPHEIYTRTIREASACGCQVVSGRDYRTDNLYAVARKIATRINNPIDTRSVAEANWNPQWAAEQMIALCEEHAGVTV